MKKALCIAVAAIAAILLGLSAASTYGPSRVDSQVVDIDLPGGG